MNDGDGLGFKTAGIVLNIRMLTKTATVLVGSGSTIITVLLGMVEVAKETEDVFDAINTTITTMTGGM